MAVGEPVSVDELAARTGRPAAECLADLSLLEVVRPSSPGRQADGS